MKLNYKRTILVGFAFFLICAFWQIYDVTIAMTLTSKFGMSQTASGVIMALDNILALFMLPLFGGISDRHKGKSGRRTPFIRTGAILAIVFLMALSFADNFQLKQIEKYTKINDPATMEIIYEEQKD
ncbi:MAG: MFS transporter, partial [Clostridia bacterium]|nr:MFS transporter [Clostridia bacterium]